MKRTIELSFALPSSFLPPPNYTYNAIIYFLKRKHKKIFIIVLPTCEKTHNNFICHFINRLKGSNSMSCLPINIAICMPDE